MYAVAVSSFIFHESSWDMFYHIGSFDPPLIVQVARMAKVCVAMFVILSGYGLSKSAEKSEKVGLRFTYDRLIKLYMPFWFIFIIFVPLGFVFGRDPVEIYGSGRLAFMKHILTDFMGVSYLVNRSQTIYTMNVTWWYMSTMILLYCIFPLLYRIMKKVPLITLMVTLILCWYDNTYSGLLFTWLFPFTFGMWLAYSEKMDRLINVKDIKGWLILILFFAVSVIVRYIYRVKMDAFFGLSIILLVVNATNHLKHIGAVLAFIGKHSGNIFMFHTFIYSYYFKNIIYSLWYPPLIYAALLAACLLTSVGLEQLKQILGYDRLKNKLLNMKG